MNIKSKDPTPEVRQSILHQIQNELGYSEYNRLIAKVGEDGLIDFVLAQTVANTSSATSTKPSNRNSSELQGCSSHIFYIAALLGFTAGAYFPDGKNLGSLYEKLFPIIVGVMIVGVILMLIYTSITGSDVPFWTDEGTIWYLLAGLITGIIAAVAGLFVNILDVGIKALGIAIVAFTYCYLFGIVLIIPYSRWVNNMQSNFWQWVFIIAGILMTLFVLGLGWIILMIPLFW